VVFFSSVSGLFEPKENPELLFSSGFSSDFSTGLASLSVLLAPNENPVDFEVSEEDPKENPVDFSSDFADSDDADPKANPVDVPNLTGSADALGLESSELLPKTAPNSGLEAAGISFSLDVESVVVSDLGVEVFLNFSSMPFRCFS